MKGSLNKSRRALLIGGIVVAVAAAAAFLWLRHGCTPERCGPAVGAALRELVVQQEVHQAQHGAFAVSLDSLLVSVEPPVRIEMMYADARGWVARGKHDDLEGLSCAVWMGVVPFRPFTQRRVVAKEPGQVYCDFPI